MTGIYQAALLILSKKGLEEGKAMKKHVKRITTLLFAVMITAVMSVGITVPAFADTHKPVATDKVSASVTDILESGESITVTAYQIAAGDYSDLGLVGYKLANGITTDDISVKTVDNKDYFSTVQPTSAEITKLAQTIATRSGVTSKTMTLSGTTASAELEAGYWLVLISGSSKYAYNPVLLAVNYDTENGSGDDSTLLTDQKVTANQNWTLVTSNAYAKRTPVDITKQIKDSNGNSYGGDVNIGDDVTFLITADIPAYSDSYKDIVWYVTDELSAGLTYNKDAVVKVGTTEAGAASVDGANYEVKYDGQKMTVTLKGDTYIKSKGGQKVYVTYTAKLNGTAGINFDKNKNTAKLTYSNNPGGSGTGTTDEKTTYTYTFAIDGLINGSSSNKTKDVYKTGTTVTDGNSTTSPLAGATFGIFTDQACTTAVKAKDATTGVATTTDMTAVTDTNGLMTFSGLKEGTYYIKELKAPKGWSLNADVTKAVIKAEYNENGTLKNYTITMTDVNDSTKTSTKTYTATYDGTTVESVVDHTSEAGYEIKDTKLPNLPSTGGLGTFLFTLIGVVILATAGIMAMKGRKDDEELESEE